MKKFTLPAVLAISIGVLPAALMADAEDSIKYRQSVFQVMKWHMGSLGDMAQGKKDYDAEMAKHNAQQLNAMTNMIVEGFGEGTRGGNAKAEIWQDWDTFASAHTRLQGATVDLVSAAEQGTLESLRPAVGQVGMSCKNCHDQFRD